MNGKLKREIVLNCFNILGLFRDKNNLGSSNLIEPLLNDKFMLDKKLAFEIEDGSKKETAIYAALTKIENNVIKVLIADIIDNSPEYAVIIRMDNFPSIAMRLSIEEDDLGSLAFSVEKQWIEVDTLAQAKVLVGLESIANIFCIWEKMNDYKEMYDILISFMNWIEGL